jgi:hypothetical protein
MALCQTLRFKDLLAYDLRGAKAVGRKGVAMLLHGKDKEANGAGKVCVAERNIRKKMAEIFLYCPKHK